MPIANLKGVDLYYEVEDEAKDGDWVVFSHGGGDMHLGWWKQVAALKPHFRCLTYDARGSGMSSQGAVYQEPDQIAGNDLLGLLDHVGIDRAFLNGHSMGGWSVSGVAQRHPERVHGLVMSNCAFGFATPALSKWAAEMIEKIPKGYSDVWAHCFAPDFAQREPDLHYLHTAFRRLSPPRIVPRESPGYLNAYERMRDRPPVDYSGFAVPTLFIAGDQDELQLPWLIEATAKAVGGAKLVTIKDSGHCPDIERPEIYNAILIDFFHSVRSRKT